MSSLLLRLAAAAVAVWVSTLVIPGITVTAATTWGTIGTMIAVALIFGVVNAVLKPVIKLFGCAIYLLTLGLIAFIVNGLLFWLTSAIAGAIDLPFHVASFWPSAVLGALLVSVVSWLIGLLIPDAD